MGFCFDLSSCRCEPVKNKPTMVELQRTIIKEVPQGNPNHSIGNHLVVEIFYPDCKNYEGRKILVYSNTSLECLMSCETIDPHFCNQPGCLSPIARFEPTEFGWGLALRCCENINLNKKGKE